MSLYQIRLLNQHAKSLAVENIVLFIKTIWNKLRGLVIEINWTYSHTQMDLKRAGTNT